MSIEEASLQLEISPEAFLVFLNQNTNSVNVIHKRKDGNHGLIEPGF
jgi:putative sigma-54 modulation protein